LRDSFRPSRSNHSSQFHRQTVQDTPVRRGPCGFQRASPDSEVPAFVNPRSLTYDYGRLGPCVRTCLTRTDSKDFWYGRCGSGRGFPGGGPPNVQFPSAPGLGVREGSARLRNHSRRYDGRIWRAAWPRKTLPRRVKLTAGQNNPIYRADCRASACNAGIQRNVDEGARRPFQFEPTPPHFAFAPSFFRSG